MNWTDVICTVIVCVTVYKTVDNVLDWVDTYFRRFSTKYDLYDQQ